METPWLQIARSLVGTRETPGAKNTASIMGWANKLGARVLGIVYPGDSTPWCGLFTAHCVAGAGLAPPKIAIRAKSWASWGTPVPPCVGAILVFSRKGGGHVGFYIGEDEIAYHVLGGNQSDAVNATRILKSRCIASRWPAGVPITGKPSKRLACFASGKVSTNEA